MACTCRVVYLAPVCVCVHVELPQDRLQLIGSSAWQYVSIPGAWMLTWRLMDILDIWSSKTTCALQLNASSESMWLRQNSFCSCLCSRPFIFKPHVTINTRSRKGHLVAKHAVTFFLVINDAQAWIDFKWLNQRLNEVESKYMQVMDWEGFF